MTVDIMTLDNTTLTIMASSAQKLDNYIQHCNNNDHTQFYSFITYLLKLFNGSWHIDSQSHNNTRRIKHRIIPLSIASICVVMITHNYSLTYLKA